MKTVKFLSYVLGSLISILIFLGTIFYIRQVTISSFETAMNYYDEKDVPEQNIELVVGENPELDDVADILYDNGLINNKSIFLVESFVNREHKGFNEGVYNINTTMSTSEIRNILSSPPIAAPNEIVVVVREGLTLKETGELLEHKGVVSQQDFMVACEEGQYNYAFLSNIPDRPNKLEGYVFPDTYYFLENMNAEQVVNKMLSRFDDIYNEEFRARTFELDTTIDEIIIIASMIEKEIRVDEERELASSVIYNRLDLDMNLGMCSTVLYTQEKRKDRLLDEDLKVETPYNTYINSGLPIGPISNPGKACIEAALYPADTDFLYFVVKDEEAGEHFFTDNYDAFLNAKSTYNQKF